MAKTGDNSYLDLCVHADLRMHVLSADAAALFSADLKRILWCNAYGARVFGGAGVADLLSARLSDEQSFVHQLRSVIGRLDRQSVVTARFRLQEGSQKRLIPFEISKITIDLDMGYLVIGRQEGKTPGKQKIARATVESLDGFADSAAVLNRNGEAIKASPSFSKLAPDQTELAKLLTELADEEDRLVKRLVKNEAGETSALGLALVSDKPWRALAVLAKAEANVETKETIIATQPRETNETDELTKADEADSLVFHVPEASENETDQAETIGLAEDQEETEIQDDVEIEEAAGYELEPYALVVEPGNDGKQSLEPVPPQDTKRQDHDHEPEPVGKGDGEMLRFTWSMDAENRFEQVSDELAKAVGPNAADIVGRRWKTVASAFAMDDGGQISECLASRDTWSGHTVLWPVEGTQERVRIQLAALPRYDLNREFHGYRGFGEVQMDERVPDLERIGLALSSDAPSEDAPISENDEAWSRLGETEDNFSSDTKIGDKHHSEEEPDIVLRSTVESDLELAQESEGQSNVVPLNRKSEEQGRLTSSEANALKKIADTLRDDHDAGNVLPIKSGSNKPTAFAVTGQTETTPASENPSTDTPAAVLEGARNALEQDRNIAQPSQDTVDDGVNLLDRLPVSVLIYDDEQLLYANQNFLSATGYGSLEALEITGGIDTVLQKQEDSPTITVRTHDGGSLSVDAKLHTVPWKGQKAMMLSFAEQQDSKHEPSSENMVPESEPALAGLAGSRTLMSLLNITKDGIALTDKNGAIVSLNASAEEIFDLSARDVQGEPLSTLFAAESQTTVSSLLEDAAGPGVSSIRLEARKLAGQKADGTQVNLDMGLSRMNESGEALVVLRPSTMDRELEASAEDEDADPGETETRVLAQVSHEIRTPLNAIIGFSDMMIEEQYGSIDNDRYRQYLKDIKRSGTHVLELVNDLLDLSKVESGRMELDFEAIDLNPLIAETVALLQPQANAARIVIRTSLSNAVPKVVADTRSIRQIILNLVSNAINYSDPNGQVIISSVYEENGEVALRVKDRGPGMSPEEIEEALRPFRQIKSKSSRSVSGTGLGLPLTKALVEANRAYFELESEPGVGTIAHVQFPSQRILAD